MPVFVDCHTHMVPSGDDGVGSVSEGRALCREAYARGTRILFATPHVWPHLPLEPEREATIRKAYAELRPQVGLELRLGFELTPTAALLNDDPRRYVLEGTDAVLMEVPFLGSTAIVFALAERIAREGLRPVIAHPERTESVLQDPSLASKLAERGWLLQVNATSLLGRHGPEIEELGWRLLEDGEATLVASDGHRSTRPPYLDTAFALAGARLGESALALFDGSALGIPTGARSADRSRS
jgi:protein-tyrosine phosphatase